MWKAQIPNNVCVQFEPFCDYCTNFEVHCEPMVSQSMHSKHCTYYIRCEHLEHCRRLADRLKKAQEGD